MMQLSHLLLNWYDKNKRSFPWREKIFIDQEEHAYHTWICEVMSQQTLLQVLLPKYNEFVLKIPNIETLANSTEESLRELWKGLGYYARARNLQKGAKYILENLNGQFPKDKNGWLKVPGCGNYTSSIIASICYNQPIVAVDGNVVRVVSRIHNIQDADIWKPSGTKKVFLLLQNYIPENRPGDFNQSLMDLGATICKKRNPICKICPLSNLCKSYINKTTHLCPPVKPRKKPVHQNVFAFIIKQNQNSKNAYLLKRNDGFLKGTFGFPLLKPNHFSWEQTKSILDKGGWNASICSKQFKHSITHHKILGYVIIVQKNTSQNQIPIYELLDFQNEIVLVEYDQIKNKLSSSLDQKVFNIWNDHEKKYGIQIFSSAHN